MYEIYKVSDDKYQLHSKFVQNAVEGTQLHILVYAVQVLGFDPQELELGLLDMIQRDNDAVHFGLYRTFMWSFNRKDKHRKAG